MEEPVWRLAEAITLGDPDASIAVCDLEVEFGNAVRNAAALRTRIA